MKEFYKALLSITRHKSCYTVVGKKAHPRSKSGFFSWQDEEMCERGRKVESGPKITSFNLGLSRSCNMKEKIKVLRYFLP